MSIRNVLLRGCILKNTKYVYGAVISTGTDTKVEFKLNPLKWYQLSVLMEWGFEVGTRETDRIDAAIKPVYLTDGYRAGDSLHYRTLRSISAKE